MALESTRKLTDEVFNAMLFQECVAAENYFTTEDLHGVAPTVIRAIYLTDTIGEAPFVQTLPIENSQQQTDIINEGAAAVGDEYKLAAVLFMTSIKYTDPNNDESVVKLMITGQTPDGRKNLAVYQYDKDEDDRYYIRQETVIPHTINNDLETDVPALDAYIKAYIRHRLMVK